MAPFPTETARIALFFLKGRTFRLRVDMFFFLVLTVTSLFSCRAASTTSCLAACKSLFPLCLAMGPRKPFFFFSRRLFPPNQGPRALPCNRAVRRYRQRRIRTLLLSRPPVHRAGRPPPFLPAGLSSPKAKRNKNPRKRRSLFETLEPFFLF